jgi:hypothetical protein
MSWWKRGSDKNSENLANKLAAQFKGQFSVDPNQLQIINNQELPTLKIDNIKVSDTNIVTPFSHNHDCVCSVFVKYGDEFYRVVTTLRKADGSLALGTPLTRANPAYDTVIKGERFNNIINLFGVEYSTQYIPIFDSQNNLIGNFFLGVRLKSYREARAFQICLVFSCALLLQLFTQNPHVAWIGFTVMLIYAGFAKGASLQRTRERVLGVILGIFIGFIVWFIGQIDFRFVVLCAPILIFMTVFFIGRNFIYQSAFIVSLSVLGVDYYKSSDYAVGNFLFDYLIFTLVAFAICVIFDHVVFRKENLMRKFYFDLQDKILTHLNQLFIIVTTDPMRQSRYLKKSNQFNILVLDLYAFIESTRYDFDIEDRVLAEQSIEFREKMQAIYHNIRRLFLGATLQKEQLILQTRQLLEELEKSVYTI